MCELFGLSASDKVDINKELKEFFSHAPKNPDGWGLSLHDNQKSFFYKEEKRADKSRYLEGLLTGGIRVRDAVAHIRLATVGYEDINNTHPFTAADKSGREWVLAHNGTIFECDPLNPYMYVQKGETDSERLLLYIIDRMNERIKKLRRPLDEDQRFNVLERVIEEVSPRNKLNLLLYDGEVLYVHTNFRDSLYERKDDTGYCFSTVPLSTGDWKRVPFARLLSFRRGVLLCEGRCHGNEYIPDENSVNALYLAYSGL